MGLEANLKAALVEETRAELEENYEMLRSRFQLYLWIEFGVSVVFFAAVVIFQFWVKKIKFDDSITIRNFSLEISSLDQPERVSQVHSQYLYNNQHFLDTKVRKEPHSVHTFYKKTAVKGQNFFFGKSFKETFNNFQHLESHSSIRTDAHSKRSIQPTEADSRSERVIIKMNKKDKLSSKESVPNSAKILENSQSQHFSFPVRMSTVNENKVCMEDLEFKKLCEILKTQHRKEDIVRYFRDAWGCEVKSVKFVFDFKETLPHFITIAKNSYKLSKIEQKCTRWGHDGLTTAKKGRTPAVN